MTTKIDPTLTSYKLLISTDDVPHTVVVPTALEIDITDQLKEALKKYDLTDNVLYNILGVRATVRSIEAKDTENTRDDSVTKLYDDYYVVQNGIIFKKAMDSARDLLKLTLVNKTQLEAAERQLHEIEDAAYNSPRRLMEKA